MRPVANGRHVGGQLALKDRPGAHDAAAVLPDMRDVSDQRASEARGKRRRKVARLVGVRQKHERRRQLADQTLQRLQISIRRVQPRAPDRRAR